MKAGRRDLRLLGTAITAGVIVLGGAGVALLPAGPAPQVPRTPPHETEVALAFSQGVAMLRQRRYEHALGAFHRVLQFAPAMPEAHTNMGFALVGLGRHREAKTFFEGAIDLRPAQLNAYYGLAVAAEGLGDLPAARGAMRAYLHLTPSGDPFRRKAEAALWEWDEAPASAGRRTGERR
jgi:tetratricopeptide (TPR) repeat protein